MTFTTYGTAEGLGDHPAVNAFRVDRAGSLWVGTRGGLFRFAPTGPHRFIEESR